ncbi:MAG: NTF2 fold immunity protein [Azovibrio sp.]
MAKFFIVLFGFILLPISTCFAECNSTGDKVYSRGGFYFPEEGFVRNKKLAIQVAEIFLTSIYGKVTVASKKPLEAFLADGVWTVSGTIPPGSRGDGMSIFICQKTGEVLGMALGR